MKTMQKSLRTVQKSCVILVLLGFGFLTNAQTQDPAQTTNPLTGVAGIEAYSKALDTFKKRNPNLARWFGDVAAWDRSGMTLNAPSAKWQEFKSRKARESAATGNNLYDLADVWMRDDKVVIVEYSSGSPSGDWSQSVTYYFRDDGTLAKMRSTFAGFNLNPFANPEEFGARLVQTRIYDTNGKRLSKRLQCFELGENGRQRRCSGEYSRYEGQAYLKVQRLPIYRLLNSQRLNDVASIQAYVRSLEAFKKRNPNRARIFGNLISPNQERYPIPHDTPRFWEEFPTRKARESTAVKRPDSPSYDGADVWIKNGKITIVQVEPDRYSYGGERMVTYYFREDGSLAKMRFKFSYDGVSGDVVKEVIYDVKGNVLHTQMQCVQTNDIPRPRIVNCSRIRFVMDYAPPVYKKVGDLPFNDLLNEQP